MLFVFTTLRKRNIHYEHMLWITFVLYCVVPL